MARGDAERAHAVVDRRPHTNKGRSFFEKKHQKTCVPVSCPVRGAIEKTKNDVLLAFEDDAQLYFCADIRQGVGRPVAEQPGVFAVSHGYVLERG